jgi:hypothetical protein
METITKHFTIVGDKAVSSLPLFLHQAGWVTSDDPLIKSANTKTSEYRVFAHTYDSLNSLCLRSFSLNELEAEFDLNTKEIRSVTLRDTAVHKKITFNKKGAILTYARGQDVVGQNSEVNSLTTKEPISKITINSDIFAVPFDVKVVYEKITGLSVDLLTDDDLEEEQRNANLWTDLIGTIEGGN